MRSRENEAWEKELHFSSLDDEDLPTEKTQYFGILCGINKGTIENVKFKERTYYPEFFLYPNENDKIFIGLVCGLNDGTISGITMLSPYWGYHTLDKDTRADLGTVCGYQTKNGVLENVDLEEAGTEIEYWGENILNIAPVVYAGVLIGEAEGGTTIRDIRRMVNCRVNADHSLADADIRAGGIVGYVSGDIELSGFEIDEISVKIDARDDQEGHTLTAHTPLAAGGLIGWADGNVTLSDIDLADVSVHIVRRPGGDPDLSYAGGFIGYCGGDLTAGSLSMVGNYEEQYSHRESIVETELEQGTACAGGLCGYCAGAAVVSDSHIRVIMNPLFCGDKLYEANVLGYVCKDAAFTGVEADCGIDEYSGESRGHSIVTQHSSVFYLAALAGGAEGEVIVEGCTIDVNFSIMGSPAGLYGGGEEGFYNKTE